MPLHLLPIMLAVLAFMLWIAFQDGDESELLELGEGVAPAQPGEGPKR